MEAVRGDERRRGIQEGRAREECMVLEVVGVGLPIPSIVLSAAALHPSKGRHGRDEGSGRAKSVRHPPIKCLSGDTHTPHTEEHNWKLASAFLPSFSTLISASSLGRWVLKRQCRVGWL